MENAISFDYFVYSRPAGERRFALTDLARGTVGLGKFYAPRYSKEQLDHHSIYDALSELPVHPTK